ncbi:MAG: hypothetical protein ACTSQA_00260 [Candidatus Heimdallarchaeaceae archaeon]
MVDEASMHAIGIEITESLKDKLTKEHGKFTGALQSSIHYRIDGDDIVISMEDYGEYLEYGFARPTTPEEIMSWVEAKIIPNLKGKHSVDVKRKIAENLAKHITKFGSIPFPFVRTTIKNDIPKILRKYT